MHKKNFAKVAAAGALLLFTACTGAVTDTPTVDVDVDYGTTSSVSDVMEVSSDSSSSVSSDSSSSVDAMDAGASASVSVDAQ